LSFDFNEATVIVYVCTNHCFCAADDRVRTCTWIAVDAVHHRADIQCRCLKGCPDSKRTCTGVQSSKYVSAEVFAPLCECLCWQGGIQLASYIPLGLGSIYMSCRNRVMLSSDISRSTVNPLVEPRTTTVDHSTPLQNPEAWAEHDVQRLVEEYWRTSCSSDGGQEPGGMVGMAKMIKLVLPSSRARCVHAYCYC
jgi:hypothetical protein